MEITRFTNPKPSAKSQLAEDLALGLMGIGDMQPDHLSESITWQKGSDGALIGKASVTKAVTKRDLRKVVVDEVVTHGKAAAVSGRLRTQNEAKLFCHMIKFTSVSAKQVASIVSFEHRVKDL